MKLSRETWNSYVRRLSAINRTAGLKMRAWIDAHGIEDVDMLVAYAFGLTTRYGEAASAAACQMYDEIAAMQKARVPAAEPKQTQNIQYVDKAIRTNLKRSPLLVPSTVGEMVKRTGAETTLKNAQRDGAYFAWVPHGDSCPFCIALASNGWRRASKKTINGDHAEHIHKNCDCEFAISFGGPGNIEGYDPDKYRDMYDNADGNTWADKVNSMRRQNYAANRDEINAQKRAAYAERAAGGRILDLYGEYETKWAESYYEEIRHKTTDCRKISERTGIDEETIMSIKKYLFFDGKWYNPITGESEQFVPDAAIAQSWQRLAEGKKIEPHDLTLIRHEELEMQIKMKNPAISHDEAHILASQEYNYQKEAEDYYANLRRNKKSK